MAHKLVAYAFYMPNKASKRFDQAVQMICTHVLRVFAHEAALTLLIKVMTKQ